MNLLTARKWCFLAGLGVFLTGCGAGTADIPTDLPAPKPLAGQQPGDIAKEKGLTPPTAPTKLSRTFNPTNPGP